MALHVRGVVLPDDEVRDLYLVGDRVTYQRIPGAETIADSGFILPGLVDAHCHIGIMHGSVPAPSLREVRKQALVEREVGVLALRDAGSPIPYPELDDDPDLPRLIRAGRHLAPPRRYLRDIALECEPEELIEAAVAQAKAGNGWVKLVGDWIDREAGDLGPTYDEATITAVVAAVHEAGARIAAHTFSETAVATLVRAGVDSIEHGTGLSPDLLDEMARQGIALVPTMINVETFESIARRADPKFPRYASHMRRLRAAFPQLVRSAYQAGVPIFVGTDAGGGIAHGQIAAEMRLLREEAGMAPLDVLAAASWKAREWLGLPGLEEGGLADLVVYSEDPRREPQVVAEPQRIVLRGRVVR